MKSFREISYEDETKIRRMWTTDDVKEFAAKNGYTLSHHESTNGEIGPNNLMTFHKTTPQPGYDEERHHTLVVQGPGKKMFGDPGFSVWQRSVIGPYHCRNPECEAENKLREFMSQRGLKEDLWNGVAETIESSRSVDDLVDKMQRMGFKHVHTEQFGQDLDYNPDVDSVATLHFHKVKSEHAHVCAYAYHYKDNHGHTTGFSSAVRENSPDSCRNPECMADHKLSAFMSRHNLKEGHESERQRVQSAIELSASIPQCVHRLKKIGYNHTNTEYKGAEDPVLHARAVLSFHKVLADGSHQTVRAYHYKMRNGQELFDSLILNHSGPSRCFDAECAANHALDTFMKNNNVR